MIFGLLRQFAAAAACVASIAVLGFIPARAGAGADRVVRLTRGGPLRTEASTAPAHPYEETAPVPVVASQDIFETKARDAKIEEKIQEDSPVMPRRSSRSTAAAWWGALAGLSSPTHAPPGRLADNNQVPFGPFEAPSPGRAPPAS